MDSRFRVRSEGWRERLAVDECFYEKVIKVKADVAALLDLFSEICFLTLAQTSDGDLQGCQGRPEGGVHLDP